MNKDWRMRIEERKVKREGGRRWGKRAWWKRGENIVGEERE